MGLFNTEQDQDQDLSPLEVLEVMIDQVYVMDTENEINREVLSEMYGDTIVLGILGFKNKKQSREACFEFMSIFWSTIAIKMELRKLELRGIGGI